MMFNLSDFYRHLLVDDGPYRILINEDQGQG